MTVRLLPREEWDKLAGTELESIAPHLPPDAHVVVVEDGDTLAACWALYRLVHAEGVYVAPAYRKNPRVARRLLFGMTQTASAMGAAVVQTAAVSDDVASMALRLGAFELPGRHFSLKIKREDR